MCHVAIFKNKKNENESNRAYFVEEISMKDLGCIVRMSYFAGCEMKKACLVWTYNMT